MHSYVIALDQGTTSSRAVIFDEQAQIVAMKSFEFEQIYPQPGWVEHDPAAILNTQSVPGPWAAGNCGHIRQRPRPAGRAYPDP